MKRKLITTIGAIALTAPALAMTAHAANHADHEREAHEQVPHQQHEPGTRERGAMRMHHEDDADMAEHHRERMAAHHDQAFRSDTVIGQDLVDQQGNEVGTIQNLLIDRDGRVVAVLVDAGGVMGIGAETKALEWDRIEVQMGDDGELDRVTTMMSQQELEQLPEFDEDRQQ